MKLQELVPTSLQNKYGKIFMGGKPEYDSSRGKDYDLSKWQGNETEENTPIENRISYILQSHLSGNQEADFLMKLLPDLQELAKSMPWLKPKINSKVYRGTTLKDKDLLDAIVKLYQEKKDVPDAFPLNIHVKYTGKKIMQSWSVDLQSGLYYRKRNEMNNDLGIPCMLQYSIQSDSEFYFPDEVLYSAAAIWSYYTEHEVIRFGNEPLICEALIEKFHIEKYLEWHGQK
jgi:hypothetical protein